MSYTKLATSILTSTIWMEDDQTRIVWLTLLAMADKNGEVQASIPGLANVARVSVESCDAAIEKFLSPDPYSRTKDDEGRRIEEIRGGWSLINHAEYRELASDEDRKRKAAERQQRARDKAKRNSEVTDRHKSSRQIPQAEAEADKKTHNAVASSVSEKPKRRRASAATGDDPKFEEFWTIYPVRKAKGKARTAWAKAIKKADPEVILESAEIFQSMSRGKDQQYLPHPATWLNGECWTDETSKKKDPFWYMDLPEAEREAFVAAELAK